MFSAPLPTCTPCGPASRLQMVRTATQSVGCLWERLSTSPTMGVRASLNVLKDDTRRFDESLPWVLGLNTSPMTASRYLDADGAFAGARDRGRGERDRPCPVIMAGTLIGNTVCGRGAGRLRQPRIEDALQDLTSVTPASVTEVAFTKWGGVAGARTHPRRLALAPPSPERSA